MLTVSTLLNQLNTRQQLAIETDLQSKVAYNSSSLSVFSSMLFGESKSEILASCVLDNNNYPRKERPIFQAIIDFYGLKADNSRDQFWADVYFAIHEETYESRVQKVKRLENLFHQMKRFELEEDSAELLNELEKLSIGTPLHTVYEHLFIKYNEIEINNRKAYLAFENLNVKLSDYLDLNAKEHTLQDLIQAFKQIRTIHHSNENRISECILNTSMLLLANYCGQTQLLKENKWTLNALFATCKTQIEKLPFGVERFFMKNIFDSNLKFALLNNSIEVTNLAFQRLSVNESSKGIHNFGLEIREQQQQKKISKSEQLISSFVKSVNTTTAMRFKQNSALYSPHRI